MVDINIKQYTDAKACTITLSNRELFWARIHDVQEGLCVKNMSDLVRKKFMVFLRLKIPQKIKSENIKDMKKNWIIIVMLLLCMFVVIPCQE